MKRAEVTEKILSAKRIKELTWEEIAKKIGGASKIIVTAACMGQMKMTKEQATKAAISWSNALDRFTRNSTRLLRMA